MSEIKSEVALAYAERVVAEKAAVIERMEATVEGLEKAIEKAKAEIAELQR